MLVADVLKDKIEPASANLFFYLPEVSLLTAKLLKQKMILLVGSLNDVRRI